MGNTVIYAVGGTGAKLLESFVHLCAAGLASGRFAVRLVDQDMSNGNVARVRELIRDYRSVWDWLRANNDPAQETHPIFGAEITFADEVFAVVPGATETLARVFGLHETAANNQDENDLLMQALFSPQQRANTMENGFRGQPAVGAAVFLSQKSRDTSRLWSQVDDDVDSIEQEGTTQFVLMGSLFGGTGASGIPTLADYLRNKLTGVMPPVRRGAVLMLRYYGVRGSSAYGPAASAKIKAAMGFYHQVMSAQGVGNAARLFDSIYLAGLHPELEVQAEPRGGGQGQANPALFPELVGALGALHFVAAGAPFHLRDRTVHLCGYAEGGQVRWNSLPRTGSANDDSESRRLASFARFALCYAYRLHPADQLSKVPQPKNQPLYLRLINVDKMTRGDYDGAAKSLQVYTQKFLRWLGAIHAVDRDQQGVTRGNAVALALGRCAELVERQPNSAEGYALRLDPAKLETYKPKQLEYLDEVFDSLWPSETDSFASVVGSLARPAAKRAKKGLGPMVAAAYKASRL